MYLYLYLRFLGFFLSFEQKAWLTRANECLLNEIKDRLPILKEQDRKSTVLVVVKPKRNYLSTCIYPLFECIWKHRLGLMFASSTLSPVRGYAQGATETPAKPLPQAGAPVPWLLGCLALTAHSCLWLTEGHLSPLLMAAFLLRSIFLLHLTPLILLLRSTTQQWSFLVGGQGGLWKWSQQEYVFRGVEEHRKFLGKSCLDLEFYRKEVCYSSFLEQLSEFTTVLPTGNLKTDP